MRALALAVLLSGCAQGSTLAALSDTARTQKDSVTSLCERETGSQRCRDAIELYDNLMTGNEKLKECVKVKREVIEALARISALLAGG